MLTTIILREMQEYIKSKRFLIGMLVTVLLVSVSTLINIDDYTRRQQNGRDAEKEMAFSESSFHFYRQPDVLSILVRGKDGELGERLDVNSGDISFRTTGYGGFWSDERDFSARFGQFDFSFIVRVLLSLFTLFLSYTIVSEEKAAGTLRLTLSCSLPRTTLLAGKSIAALTVIISSLVFSSFAAFLILYLHPMVGISSEDILRIGAIAGVSALYLAVFFSLGLFVSVLANRPSTALMALLETWFILVMLLPNAGVILAERWISTPGEREIQERRQAVNRPIDEEIEQICRKIASLKDEQKWEEAIFTQGHPLENRRIELLFGEDWAIHQDYRRQTDAAERIAILSPAVFYDQIASRLARTGIDEYERFILDVFQYWKQNIGAVKSSRQLKDIFLDQKSREKLPRFTSSPEPLTKSLTAVAESILLLFFAGAMFLSLSFAAFLRKDVR